MKRMYEFACVNGHKTSRLVVYETHKQLCRVESPTTDSGRKRKEVC